MHLGSSVSKRVVKELIEAGIVDGGKVKINKSVLDVDDDYIERFTDAYLAYQQTKGLVQEACVVSDEVERFRQEHGFKTYSEAKWILTWYSSATRSYLCKGRPLFEAIKEYIKVEVEHNKNKRYIPTNQTIPEEDLRFIQLALNYASFSLLQEDCYKWYCSIVDTEEYFYNWLTIKELEKLCVFRYSRNNFKKILRIFHIINMVYDVGITIGYHEKNSYFRADTAFMITQFRYIWAIHCYDSLRRYLFYSLVRYYKGFARLLRNMFSEYRMSMHEWISLCKLKLDLHTHPKRLLL